MHASPSSAAALRFETIVCLDDLLRDSYWPAKEFIYDLIRHPIFRASGLNIAKSPRRGQRSNLLPGFEVTQFMALCGIGGSETAWASAYAQIPDAAAEYLGRHLPPNALVLSYEMPPWLRRVLEARGLVWLDVRISPLRFGADLYLGLRTNDPGLYAAAHSFSVPAHEIAAEAALLAAKLRYRLRYAPRVAALEQQCVYIGQTESDASLLDDAGRFVRVDDYAETLHRLAVSGPLQYKPHPLAGDFGRRERLLLERVTGRPVALCEIDTYELLAREENVLLVGLSSGVLQEAPWFGREAYALFRPIALPRFDAAHHAEGLLQIASHRFMGQPLWSALVGGSGAEPPLVFPPRPNHLRELHNTWWGYSTAMLRYSAWQREAFGMMKADTLATDPRVDALLAEVQGLKEALRAVLRRTATRASADEAIHT